MRGSLSSPLILTILLFLAACAQLVPAPEVAPDARPPEDAWARVLNRFVDDQGRVDFVGLARERVDLDSFVAWVYAVGPNNRPALFPTRALCGQLHGARVPPFAAHAFPWRDAGSDTGAGSAAVLQ